MGGALTQPTMEPTLDANYLRSMDSEMRAAFAALNETLDAGFARMDRYFEMQQKQFLEWRAELTREITEIRIELHDLRSH